MFTEDDFRTFYRVTFNFDILLFVKFFFSFGGVDVKLTIRRW